MQQFGSYGAAQPPISPKIQALTMKFLDPDRALPGQASPVAQKRAFGQQGAAQGRPRQSPGEFAPSNTLSDRFLALPEPIAFMQTPQGQAIMERIIRQFSGRAI